MSEMLDQLDRNERQEWDCDHDSHVAWVSVAMGLATEYAEAYCNHRTEDDRDYLPDFIKARRELHQHLLGQPASMGPERDRIAELETQLAEARELLQELDSSSLHGDLYAFNGTSQWIARRDDWLDALAGGRE